jgi:hypothetical protein
MKGFQHLFEELRHPGDEVVAKPVLQPVNLPNALARKFDTSLAEEISSGGFDLGEVGRLDHGHLR